MTLTRELMGLAALAVSWMTGLMIVLDAWIDVRRFRAMLASWAPSLVQGTAQTEGLATHSVEQRVKELDQAEPGLIFFDRQHTSTIAGGAVALEGAVVRVSGAPGAEVWFDDATRQQNAACTGTAQFDVLQRMAQQAGGGTRVVTSTVRAGQPVWLVGERQGEAFTATLVSTFDPRTFARARITASLGVCVASTLWVALGTTLALWAPVFGPVSTLGAVVLVGHFLGMTPLAMAAREKSRVPAVAFLRGEWQRPQAKVTSPATA